MIDILSLISDLKARAAHAKVHAIHINLTWEGFTLRSNRNIRVLILKHWHLNLDLLLPALVDRLG